MEPIVEASSSSNDLARESDSPSRRKTTADTAAKESIPSNLSLKDPSRVLSRSAKKVQDEEHAISVKTHRPPSSPVNDDDDNSLDDSSDEEDEDDAAWVNRQVIRLQRAVRRVTGALNARCGDHLLAVLCLLLYAAYFSYAMYYRFGDEGSVRLLWCTVLGVLIVSSDKMYKMAAMTLLGAYCMQAKSPSQLVTIQTLRFFTRWFLYGAVGGFMAYVTIDVGIEDANRLRSLPGIFVFLLLSFLLSSHPSKVEWHTVYWSLGLQFIVAVAVLRWDGGRGAVIWVQTRLDEFFANSRPAAILMFGETYTDHYMVFGAMPIVFLTNSALAALYYLGAMQFVVRVIGQCMRYILGTTPVESTGVAASIFMEGASAVLALRPYLGQLTHSELFAITTSSLSSIGGAFLAILAQIGIPMEFMLPAMVVSAPATFAVCKLIHPESRRPRNIQVGAQLPPEMQYSTLIEAAQLGALSVVSLVVNVVVTAFTFFALISWANSTCVWFGDRVGLEQLTTEKILSYLFYPFAVLMGVDLPDCRRVGMLMGLRLSASNFLALLKMSQLAANRERAMQYLQVPNATLTSHGDDVILDLWNVTLTDGFISRRSEAISTYALCGMSSILSLFITLGVMATLVPRRRQWIVSMATPLLVAGNLANFMVGCFAGLLV